MTNRAVLFAMIATLPGAEATAQDVEPPEYQSRFVEANGIRLQYMDFGGSGLPPIFVQDIHNYFEDDDPYYRDGAGPLLRSRRVYDPAAIYRALGIEPCCEPEPAEARR